MSCSCEYTIVPQHHKPGEAPLPVLLCTFPTDKNLTLLFPYPLLADLSSLLDKHAKDKFATEMANPPELQDAQFVTLCARYLDLKFDLAEESPEKDNAQFSSPCSYDTDLDPDPDRNWLSNGTVSTARTTPLRPGPHANDEEEYPFASMSSYSQHLTHADLPPTSKQVFHILASNINEISVLLTSNTRLDLDIASAIVNHGNILLSHIRRSSAQVKDYVSNIAFIKTLAPFRVRPNPVDLWCNYRQKAQLIVQYVLEPCCKLIND